MNAGALVAPASLQAIMQAAQSAVRDTDPLLAVRLELASMQAGALIDAAELVLRNEPRSVADNRKRLAVAVRACGGQA